MHLGDAKLGDKGDEGKEPSSLEPRVGAVVGVERCNLGKQANLGDEGDECKEPSSFATGFSPPDQGPYFADILQLC